MSHRATQPSSAFRPSDELEDLGELQVRLDDLLDSLHAMSNRTRLRIYDFPVDDHFHVDTDQLQKPLLHLSIAVKNAIKFLPADQLRSGRPPYDDVRDTPLLAAVVATWFEQFPNDDGVKRDGEYAEKGLNREYQGALLDFVLAMFKALGVDAGSYGAIGKRLHKSYGRKPSLQNRIRAKARTAICDNDAIKAD